MARGKGSVNKVILIGNCGAEPEQRSLPSGSSVVNLSLATTETWRARGSEGGEAQSNERTEWHRVVFFGNLADIVARYVHRGSKLYVEGSLRTREWEQNGVKRYTTEIVAEEMTMLDSKRNAAYQDTRADTAPPGPASSPPSQAQASAAAPSPDDFDEDIPF